MMKDRENLKIAIVCFNVDWPAGGPRLLFSSAQAIRKLGHTVIIYVPSFAGRYFRELWEGLDIRVIPPRAPFAWEGRPSFFLWLSRKISQERLHVDTARRIAVAMDDDFDIVNLHDYAFRVGHFYRRRNPRAKILWTSNDPPYMYLPKNDIIRDIVSRLYNWARDFTSRRYFRAIDRITVLDFYNKEWCAARGLTAAIIRLGVNFDHFYAPVKNFAAQAGRKSVRLMGLGALNAYRRYEDTIHAVTVLRDWGYRASALIICNDTWHESEYRAKLVRIVRENKLEDSVELRFEGGQENDIRKAFEMSDIFVYAVYLPPPRHGFGFSIAVLEAMAAGLPVIILKTTTSEEVLKDGETALLVDPMNPRHIAEKVKMLIDHPSVYRKIAEEAQRLVKERMSWEEYAKNIFSLLGVQP